MRTTQCTVAFCALALGAIHLVACQPTPCDRLATLGVPCTAEALITSVRSSQTDAVRLLLAAGIEPDATDADGVAVLAWAVVRKDAGTVRVLAAAGADLATPAGNEGMTVLMLAAQTGAPDVVRALVEAGASIDLRDEFGNTALMQAAAGGHRDVAEYLLARGAEPDRMTIQSGATALGVAAAQGDADMVALLLAHRAGTEVREASFGMTPLAVAAFKGHRDVARLLVEGGADVLAVDRDGQTPLAIAAAHHNEPVRALLARAESSRVAHGGSGLFRREAALELRPGWVLADPFTRRTPFFSSTAVLSTVRDPAGTQRALVRGPNESGSQAFLIRGPASAWTDTLRAAIAELASHPLVKEYPVPEVRTADGVSVSVRVFRMLPGLIGGADMTHVLASAAVADEAFIVDGGGPTATFSLQTILDLVAELDLARDFGLATSRRSAASQS